MRKLSALVAGGLLMAALATPAQSANADSCDLVNHCYGIVGYNESSFDAVAQQLWTDCLVIDPPVTSHFATHEMWIIFPGNNFIETGYIKGGPIAGGMTQTTFRWFWADWNGSTFTSHFVANAPILNYIDFSMWRNTGGTWSVYVNGSFSGTTTSTYGYANVIQTGGETTEDQVLSHGKSRWLQTRNASTGTWGLSQWDYVGATAGVYNVSHNTWERMEQYSLQRICDPLPGGPVGTFGAKALTSDDFKNHALAFAKDNGESRPSNVEMVSTNRQAANASKVDSDGNAHVIQMRGNFTAHAASRPKGVKAPTGKVLTLVYDSVTGELTDWSMSQTARDLSKLGKVTKL